jgi:hypothetical protein
MLIELTRAEGPTYPHPLGKAKATSWGEANRVLFDWSRSAPRAGEGYDKCDFVITLPNGAIYDGRYDLNHHADSMPNLERHVREVLAMMACIWRPHHIGEREWGVWCDDMKKRGLQSQAETMYGFMVLYTQMEAV